MRACWTSGYSEGMRSKRRDNVETWLITSIDSGSDGPKFGPRREIDGHHKMISRFK